jgi:protoporphyrinogen oxidase
MQAFKNVGSINALNMGFSYINGFVKYKIFGEKIVSFEDFIISNFGKRLGDFNMLNYTEKVWGIPCSQIHPDWGTQRIKGLNLLSTLKNAIFKSNGPKSLVDVFFYPKYGTGTIYENMAKLVKKSNGILLNTFPIKIVHKKNKILYSLIRNGKKTDKININTLISSMAITDLLNILFPKPPKKVLEAAKKLKWRNQIYIFITLDMNKVTDDNWIYFPNLNIPFGRICEIKNFSKSMSPKGKTSLFVEFFSNPNDGVWEKSDKELFNLAAYHLEKMNLIKKEKIRKYYVFREKNAYPVYDLNYKKWLKIIKDYLNNFENLYYIGRMGRFQYTNQDHSIEFGLLCADSIIENKKYDFDKIGSEDEYFEKGKIKK